MTTPKLRLPNRGAPRTSWLKEPRGSAASRKPALSLSKGIFQFSATSVRMGASPRQARGRLFEAASRRLRTRWLGVGMTREWRHKPLKSLKMDSQTEVCFSRPNED
jgi:hypothetical protein